MVHANVCNISCGLRQIYQLQFWNASYETVGVNNRDKVEALEDRRRLFDIIPVGYTILFSDNAGYKNGERLAQYIKEYDLGILTEHPEVTNPNMNSRIKTWVWTWNGKRPTDYMKLPSEVKKAA